MELTDLLRAFFIMSGCFLLLVLRERHKDSYLATMGSHGKPPVRASWGRQALVVLVLTQSIFVLLSILNYDDMDLQDLVMNSITFNLVGLGAFSGAYVTNWFGLGRGWSFTTRQIAEFAGLLVGMALGRIAGDFINYVIYDNTLIWNEMGFGSLFLEVELSLLLALGVLLGSLRLIHNVQLYAAEQKHMAQAYELLEVKEQATRAQLDSIQARINPHFLYNALNGIASMIPTHPDRAESMTLGLARLFRASLDAADQPMNTVRDEVSLIETYLAIETARFGDRLTHRIDVDPEALDVSVPRFLLQPLVENAIKHGVSQNYGPGHIALQIRHEGDHLAIRVHDNGPAFPQQLSSGYGLQSVQDSLALLYPERHQLALVSGPNKHVEITLDLA